MNLYEIYLGGNGRWVPLVIGRTDRMTYLKMWLFKFAMVCDNFFFLGGGGQTLLLKHRAQIELTQNTYNCDVFCSLRSRLLEVLGERENGHARGRHARGEGAPSPLACLLLGARFFLCPLLPSACYAGYKIHHNCQTTLCVSTNLGPSKVHFFRQEWPLTPVR